MVIKDGDSLYSFRFSCLSPETGNLIVVGTWTYSKARWEQAWMIVPFACSGSTVEALL